MIYDAHTTEADKRGTRGTQKLKIKLVNSEFCDKNNEVRKEKMPNFMELRVFALDNGFPPW